MSQAGSAASGRSNRQLHTEEIEVEDGAALKGGDEDEGGAAPGAGDEEEGKSTVSANSNTAANARKKTSVIQQIADFFVRDDEFAQRIMRGEYARGLANLDRYTKKTENSPQDDIDLIDALLDGAFTGAASQQMNDFLLGAALNN
jgi:hypothetical protein